MFDKDEEDHQRVAAIIETAGRLPLLSTWPCVTEAAHILDRLDQQLALLAYIRRGGLLVRDFAATDLDRFMAWMQKYADRPMDFADASLVWLAAESGVTEVLTTDRDDFETYRVPAGKGSKRFRLL
jgi:uncharacterized protein